MVSSSMNMGKDILGIHVQVVYPFIMYVIKGRGGIEILVLYMAEPNNKIK